MAENKRITFLRNQFSKIDNETFDKILSYDPLVIKILDLEKIIYLKIGFLITFRPNEKISFRWIRYDNRGCDVYNGGAYKISAEKVDYINLKEWLNS
jgi:hypothetical protein